MHRENLTHVQPGQNIMFIIQPMDKNLAGVWGDMVLRNPVSEWADYWQEVVFKEALKRMSSNDAKLLDNP